MPEGVRKAIQNLGQTSQQSEKSDRITSGGYRRKPVETNEQFADQVREAILERIQDGRYKPRDRLTEAGILSDLQQGERKKFATLSTGPVREALIVLEAEEILDVFQRYGAVVREVMEADVIEMLHNRCALEEFVVSQLAAMREDKVDLSESRRANERLGKLVLQVEGGLAKTAGSNAHLEKAIQKGDGGRAKQISPRVRLEVIRLDALFHGGLARAAGFPHIADTLRRLRDRMAVFSGTRMTLTGEHLRQFYDEHNAILVALHSEGEFRPDVNDARNAIRRHLRNSARRWALRPDGRSRDKRHWDMIFDLPELPWTALRASDEQFNLLAARVAIELVALKRLATDPNIRLDAPERLYREAVDLYDRFRDSGSHGDADRGQIITRFLNADLGLHVALMFLSGLQFAEEAVVHFWKLFYNDTRDALQDDWRAEAHGDRMGQVLEEHRLLLNAIRPGVQTAGVGEEVARRYLSHILSAIEHTYKGDQRDDLCRRLKLLGQALEPSWTPDGAPSTGPACDRPLGKDG